MAPALFLTLVLAQSAPVEGADPAQIERIRTALTETQAITIASSTRAQDSVFRVTVHGKPERPLWDAESATPSYVRPWFRYYQHEFLAQVTPEEFRSATLYPVGIPVLQLAELLVKEIKVGNRKRKEANAREEVRQALKELLACRANPDKPGC
jgi:hypothetical protein